ncbi:hypothetical protein TWF718_007192 [Orbilia javanica]|uniref:Uncharacterized protein n=1 Tax=Orbilia javanica TaxID=47235 RepID=A0AAN8RDN5_9PEZI
MPAVDPGLLGTTEQIHGSRPDLPDDDGMTALEHAQLQHSKGWCDKEFVELLESYCPKPQEPVQTTWVANVFSLGGWFPGSKTQSTP